jgi:hypothetical protein
MTVVRDGIENSEPSSPHRAVIVFDGVCVLCNGWVRFLLRRDRRDALGEICKVGYWAPAAAEATG